MQTHLPELLDGIQRTLRFCQVRADERIVIYTDSGRPKLIGEMFLAAAAALGADPVLISVRYRPALTEPPEPAQAAMQGGDVVFDVSTESWLYTSATQRVLESGARMLQVRGPDALRIIERAPSETIVRKAKVAQALFDAGETVRVTCPNGSDFSVRYRGRRPIAQDGVVQAPGEWDSLGTAFANVCPEEETAEGVLVLNGPCVFSGVAKFITQEPIRVTFRQGSIADVAGGDGAERVRDWLKSQNDPNMARMAHLGFGYDPRCGPPAKPVESGDFGSWEAMNGAIIIAFGANVGLGAWAGRNRA